MRIGFVIRTTISILAIGLALLIIGANLIPVRAWKQPAVAASYSGFDPSLIYVSSLGDGLVPGHVAVTQHELNIAAPVGSHPVVHLITTPVSYTASFAVTVLAESGQVIPLRIGLWSPTNHAGFFIVLDAQSGNVIRAQTIVNGTSATDLLGGTVRTDDALGQYAVGSPIVVTISVDKAHRRITVHLVGPNTLPPLGDTATLMGGQSNDVDGGGR